ncbi:hypothetical protein GQ42DRAFT_157542 [Ramicandelaber brevisporus]|nr:hypothetical protein GQ42DRAFT_157542 [Ramicandelaber brevisporus]
MNMDEAKQATLRKLLREAKEATNLSRDIIELIKDFANIKVNECEVSEESARHSIQSATVCHSATSAQNGRQSSVIPVAAIMANAPKSLNLVAGNIQPLESLHGSTNSSAVGISTLHCARISRQAAVQMEEHPVSAALTPDEILRQFKYNHGPAVVVLYSVMNTLADAARAELLTGQKASEHALDSLHMILNKKYQINPPPLDAEDFYERLSIAVKPRKGLPVIIEDLKKMLKMVEPTNDGLRLHASHVLAAANYFPRYYKDASALLALKRVLINSPNSLFKKKVLEWESMDDAREKARRTIEDIDDGMNYAALLT